ncbi:MAG: glycosyltransferase, partial [Thermodesulfobacteriota bacterium]|nr:glycosyltransferase [Thermodesulfobacteriota bacterium]
MNLTNPMNPSNPKVLHIIDSGGLYGAEMVLLNLVAEQIKQGLEPIIASIGEKGAEKPLETEAIRRGFRVEKFRMRPGPNYLGALKILKFARKEGVDILHSHGYKGNILFGLMPKKIRRIPMVSTIHGYTSTGNGFSRMRVYESLDSKALRFMDAVVFVSNAMRSNPRFKHLNQSRVHVIHNGIPIPDAQFDNSTNQPLDQSLINFCSQGFTVGSIGRLSKEKGYKYLIEALAILIKKGIDARLVIMGEGYERDYLEGLVAQFEVTDRVMLPGYIDEANLYIPLFDVFVISSLTEGLPITLLEAMQSRTPIVSSRVGGIPDMLDESRAGLLVNPSSPDAIADAVFRIYDDGRLAKALVDNAYERVYT